jgi:hypothetical protein
VDLAPSDIREVATRRVLAKKAGAVPALKTLFADNHGALLSALKLERTARRTEVSEDDFVHFYPYPPHYIDLCIGIMSGIRLQPGAPRHYGGSNRTIIKQAYEMLVSERTDMALKPLGTLVTLDKVFELVEGNLSNEKRTDIHDIAQRFKGDAGDQGWTSRVAKVICLLEFLRDLPRTEANIAAFLVDGVGQQAPLAQVKAAVKRLQAAQFVRNTEEGWKLQTAQEKNWETKRQGYLGPKQRERNDITRQVLEKVFDEPEFKTFRYQNLRTFRIGVGFEGTHAADEGELPLTLCVAEDTDDLSRKLAEVREDSRQKSHENDVNWVFALSPEIDQLVSELHASRKMVEEYDQLRSQNKITSEEATCLQDEKNAVLGYQNRLRDKLTEAMERGTGLFRGVARDASSLGKTLGEILKKLFGQVVPDLYPKLEMGFRPLNKDEAELVLKAVDLKGLPQVFYAGEHGLGLVVKDGPKYVVNTGAEVVKEVFDYLKSEQSYGNKETRMGKALEKRFCGVGYGWERDMLRLVLAVLFRAGEIEVTYQGNRFHTYQDPLARTPFTNNPAFRNSLFSPRQSLGLKALTQAVQQLEDITGEEVDVEEGAIATAFKKVASEELEKLYPLKALSEAHQLPIQTLLNEYQQTLLGIQASASDDCVRILTETGPLLQQSREKVHHVQEALTDKTIALLRQARQATGPVWQRLGPRNPAPELAECVEQLEALLGSEQVLDSLDAIKAHTKALNDAYKAAYLDLFDRRAGSYESAIEEIQNHPEWEPIATASKDVAETLLTPLRARVGSKDDRDQVQSRTSMGASSLAEMESDLAAVEGLKSSVLVKLQELAYGGRDTAPIRRVRLSNLFNRPIETQADLDAAVQQLRDALQKYIDEGAAVILE